MQNNGLIVSRLLPLNLIEFYYFFMLSLGLALVINRWAIEHGSIEYNY